MYAPPIIDEHVEHAQQRHEETGAPFGFEPYRDHDASSESDDGYENTCDRPFALENEADK